MDRENLLYAKECYSDLKKIEIMAFAIKWMELVYTTIIEMSKTPQKVKYFL